ncbi:TetR/AcrR family transcriptional regulator [Phytohabitans houttuyneae]|uniref:TetR family transcriptional regulator n=1 Tax=Phytohabitans houttuyneae TaxID=1076126 RepID=A0A6V8KMQ0_9ACTN|nr:TetR/AcrR family transcriptional regulator [Phytohabitans houttuyneae]GFJ83691.1 TetR family transcriptional regulator [Phytohabitans houttuyneae]
MNLRRRTQADRTAATRTALISAGRRLFAEHGFAGVGTEAIVLEAAVSRGALYHHFADKTELFAAVLDNVEGEVSAELAAVVGADTSGGFVEVMLRSAEAWLDACQRPEVQRIVLVDGPSVLGWARWREICQPHILGLVSAVLAQGMADGSLDPQPVTPLAHLLLAIADEAAMYVATNADPVTARREMIAIIRRFLQALTASTEPPHRT